MIGHSQGIAAAVAVAQSRSWESFEENALDVARLLQQIGKIAYRRCSTLITGVYEHHDVLQPR